MSHLLTSLVLSMGLKTTFSSSSSPSAIPKDPSNTISYQSSAMTCWIIIATATQSPLYHSGMNPKKALIGPLYGISVLERVYTVWTQLGWLSEANVSCMSSLGSSQELSDRMWWPWPQQLTEKKEAVFTEILPKATVKVFKISMQSSILPF